MSGFCPTGSISFQMRGPGNLLLGKADSLGLPKDSSLVTFTDGLAVLREECLVPPFSFTPFSMWRQACPPRRTETFTHFALIGVESNNDHDSTLLHICSVTKKGKVDLFNALFSCIDTPLNEKNAIVPIPTTAICVALCAYKTWAGLHHVQWSEKPWIRCFLKHILPGGMGSKGLPFVFQQLFYMSKVSLPMYIRMCVD